MPRVLILFITAAVILAAVLGLGGIDLVLPAIPLLPEVFETSAAKTQFVIAAYVGGTILGLLIFGSLAARVPPFRLLLLSLIGFSLTSFAALGAQTIDQLLIARLMQGFMAICPAVVAPGIIRSLYSEAGALRAISIMGSVESLSPALAPVAGAALLPFGWAASFWVTGVLALMLALLMVPLAMKPQAAFQAMPRTSAQEERGYWHLVTRRPFMRLALTQAMMLGGLLAFVFAAPAVIVRSMGGEMADFITMQIVGVTSFIIASNVTSYLAPRFQKETIMTVGTSLGLTAAFCLCLYALIGGDRPGYLVPLFLPLNVALGISGPTTFLAALQQSGGDDARASAIIFLCITLTSAGLTSLVAPFIQAGLIAPALASLAAVIVAVLSLHGLAGTPDHEK